MAAATPQPDVDPEPMTVVAGPVLGPAPTGWKPDAQARSRKGEPLKAQELLSFGAPEVTPAGSAPVPMAVPWLNADDVDDGPEPNTAVSAVPVVPDDGDGPTNVGVAPVSRPIADHDELETKVKPGPRSSTSAPAAKTVDAAATEPIKAIPRRGGALSLYDDDDAEKRRDRQVAIIVGGFGAVLIAIVFMATQYEEPRTYSQRGPLKQTGFESNTNSGGSKGGGAGGGSKQRKGGQKDSYAALPSDSMPTDTCVARCARRQQICSTTCGSAGTCREHCLEKVATCENSCGAQTGGGGSLSDTQTLECFTEDGRPKRCGPAEQKRLQQQKQAMRSLCRDSSGDFIPCPDQVAKMEAGKRYVEKNCPPGSACGARTEKMGATD